MEKNFLIFLWGNKIQVKVERNQALSRINMGMILLFAAFKCKLLEFVFS